MRLLTLFLTLLGVSISPLNEARANQLKLDVPKKAASTKEITQAVDRIKGFGMVHSREMTFGKKKQRWFVLWYCPFSGRAANVAHVYAKVGKAWEHQRSDLIECHPVRLRIDKKKFRFEDTRGTTHLEIAAEARKKPKKNGKDEEGN